MEDRSETLWALWVIWIPEAFMLCHLIVKYNTCRLLNIIFSISGLEIGNSLFDIQHFSKEARVLQ